MTDSTVHSILGWLTQPTLLLFFAIMRETNEATGKHFGKQAECYDLIKNFGPVIKSVEYLWNSTLKCWDIFGPLVEGKQPHKYLNKIAGNSFF